MTASSERGWLGTAGIGGFKSGYTSILIIADGC
jgi:hypothetical protein